MGQGHIETEVKILVDDLAVVERKLQAMGATLKSTRVYERNIRYDNADNTFASSDRVLRLRQDTKVRLTYKEPNGTESDKVTSRTELEVTISDFETMDLLLKKLGFHEAWIYEKYRTTYLFQECEVVLDELPVGMFIEVEGDPDGIERTLAALDLDHAPQILVSYSVLFFRLKQRLGLDVRDLTFENFKDIAMPPEMFR